MSQDGLQRRGNRRAFLTTTAAAGLGLLLADEPARAFTLPAAPPIVPLPRSANERIRFACIGVGGKGDSDTADAARFGDIVAICDVDDNTLARASAKYPGARKFNDYRKMFDEMAGQIDAVTVSTPDHHHFAASSIAMLLGKHCFCQKPLVHSLYEARQMGAIARKMRVATQMGNQGTADSTLRRQAAQVRAGIIGTVREIHVWTNRPIWPQGVDRADPTDVPEGLHWDIWLGPAAVRPYAPGYHTFRWRGWWDFGTGALGDMACHTLNMPYMALDLRNPTRAVAETAGHNKDSYPAWSIIHYTFPANRNRPAVQLHWYDGNKRPPVEMLEGKGQMESSGSLLIGDKGKIYIPGDYGSGGRVITGGVDVGDVPFEPSPGHFAEYVRAIREGKPAMSNFPDYAGPLVESVLLGNLAVRANGPAIEWDPVAQEIKNLRALPDREDLERIIRPTYRAGWNLVTADSGSQGGANPLDAFRP